MESLRDRTVVLTGAAGGIGQEMVLALLEAGAHVLAVDRSEEGLAALAGRAGASAARMRSLALDIRDKDAAGRIAGTALDQFGRIYALVNNAGIGRSYFWKRTDRGARFWEVSRETTAEFFAVNVTAVIDLTSTIAPHLVSAGDGRIVTVTTSFFSMLAGGMHPYGNSKAALESFAAIAAGDLEGTGVTSNVLHPGGAVDTNMVLNRPGIARSDLLAPGVMVPPLLWLLGKDGATVSGRRLTAHFWDPAKPVAEAIAAADAPIAWSSLAAGTKRSVPVRPG
jgi:3-oxoacyl-[acyl-carrier protein] reductase